MEHQVKNFLEIMKYAIRSTDRKEVPELEEPIAWEELMQVAKVHNLFALFHNVARKFPEYRERADYEENDCLSLCILAQQVQKTDAFLKLYRAFLESGLHPIVMKGIICRQLYGTYAEYRPSGDEDILVRKEEFFKVKEIMETMGYVCEQPDVTKAQLTMLQEVGFHEEKIGFLIEVHTNVMGHENQMRTQMSDCFRDVFADTRTVAVKDVMISTMSHTDHYLFLVLHAFKHFTANGVGIRQMLDILLYQESFENEIDWEKVERTLQENQALRYLGDLQEIGETYLGCSFQVRFETCSPEKLLEDMVEVGIFGKRGEADLIGARFNLNVMGKDGYRWLGWIRVAFPPKAYMIKVAPYLQEKPWLLPVEWTKRWIKFLKRAGTYDGNLIMDSVKKSRKRRELIQRYEEK